MMRKYIESQIIPKLKYLFVHSKMLIYHSKISDHLTAFPPLAYIILQKNQYCGQNDGPRWCMVEEKEEKRTLD